MIDTQIKKEIPMKYFLYPRNNFNTILHASNEGSKYQSKTVITNSIASVKIDACILNTFEVYSHTFIREFRVYFNPLTWYTKTMGHIYSDSLFLTELKKYMKKSIGTNGQYISYSMYGLQGINYVSCDVGINFIRHWIAHNYPTMDCYH